MMHGHEKSDSVIVARAPLPAPLRVGRIQPVIHPRQCRERFARVSSRVGHDGPRVVVDGLPFSVLNCENWRARLACSSCADFVAKVVLHR
jgi:hypothetical protein